MSERDKKLRAEGFVLGLRTAMMLLDDEARQHLEALNTYDSPAPGDETFPQFYAEEFARQCCVSLSETLATLLPKKALDEKKGDD